MSPARYRGYNDHIIKLYHHLFGRPYDYDDHDAGYHNLIDVLDYRSQHDDLHHLAYKHVYVHHDGGPDDEHLDYHYPAPADDDHKHDAAEAEPARG